MQCGRRVQCGRQLHGDCATDTPEPCWLLCLLLLQVWSTRGVEGVHRFLARVFRAFEGGVSDSGMDVASSDQTSRDQSAICIYY